MLPVYLINRLRSLILTKDPFIYNNHVTVPSLFDLMNANSANSKVVVGSANIVYMERNDFIHKIKCSILIDSGSQP
jgi:glutathionyl-hydroquinone reductase